MNNILPVMLIIIAIVMIIGTMFAVIFDKVRYRSSSFSQIFLIWCLLILVIDVIFSVVFSFKPDTSIVGDFTVAFSDAVSALMLYVSLATVFEDSH